MNNGTDEAEGFEEPAAARPGTDPMEGVGLFMTGGGFWSGTLAKLASVAILDCDMLLAGDVGRPPVSIGCAGNGDGDAACKAGVGWALGGLLVEGARACDAGACETAAEPVGVG